MNDERLRMNHEITSNYCNLPVRVMMSYWFFLSYAKHNAPLADDKDRVPYIEKFYKDLARELREIVVPERTDTDISKLAFFDRNIGAGETSMKTLTDALRASRVMVCLYSEAYFKRDYCGKEFEYFRLRRDEQGERAGSKPTIIIPIYWGDPMRVREALGDLPDSVKGIEIAEGELNAQYGDLGLKTLMVQSGKHRDAYSEFLAKFAYYVYDRAKALGEEPLPAPKGDPSVENVTPAFPVHKQNAAPISSGAAMTFTDEGGKGPEYARFFYIAARKEELSEGNRRADAYGRGGIEWRPFHPTLPHQIGAIVSAITGTQGFIPVGSTLDEDIEQQLKKAFEDNVVAVVVVDTWTLMLDKYRQITQKCDSVSFLNCVVLVVWNCDDQEVEIHRPKLENFLKYAFPVKSTSKDRTYFINPINNHKELQRHLSAAVISARKRIMEFGDVKNLVQGQQTSIPVLPVGKDSSS